MIGDKIIRVLECCVEKGKCNECPYYLPYGINCGYHKDKNALNLINRQKAEIERLERNLEEAFAEIEELKTLQTELVTEFAERLKEMSEHFWEEKENFVSEETIDNLVKEMAGDDR